MSDPTLDVTVPTDARSGSTLVVSLATLGMAGLTAADYMVRHLEAEQLGAVVPDGIPAIAPIASREFHEDRMDT